MWFSPGENRNTWEHSTVAPLNACLVGDVAYDYE